MHRAVDALVKAQGVWISAAVSLWALELSAMWDGRNVAACIVSMMAAQGSH